MTSLKEDECWAKCKTSSYYDVYTKEFYKKYRETFSTVYPVFTYERIKNMNIKIPRDWYDIGVYGLGSAGTAILDQLARSNWLDNIYLCDFDYVEHKNMINQWYDNTTINLKKTEACEKLLTRLNRSMAYGISTFFNVTYDTSKFQDTALDTKEFKYVVSGFDSIEVRLEFLNNILDGKIKADYLIDCRYLDLTCSIYFIDINNTEELEFYKANLEADGELMKARKDEQLTPEEFDDWVQRKGYYRNNCAELRGKYLTGARCRMDCWYECSSPECKQFLYGEYLKTLPNDFIKSSDASCLKYNYIDIYKYVGAIVFSAVRDIENGKEKPFALIEAQTDGIPNYMKVR